VPRHPSRDTELTYTNERGGLYLPGHGYYEAGELESYESQARSDPGAFGEDAPQFEPRQGQLFEPDDVEHRSRMHMSEKQFVTGYDAKAKSALSDTLSRSTIPSSHMRTREWGSSGGERAATTFTMPSDLRERGMGGYYKPTFDPRRQNDVVAADPGARGPSGPHDTIMHELGHRHHFSQYANADDPRMAINHRSQYDPLQEGVADAYVDRYGGSRSEQVWNARDAGQEGGEPLSIMSSQARGGGYHSSFRHWSPEENALYAAVRGHYGETGELPERQQNIHNPQDDAVDTTLHHLATNSPHARRALESNTFKGTLGYNVDSMDDSGVEVPLSHIAAQAGRRVMDRQLLHEGQFIQHALFDEGHAREGHHDESEGRITGYLPSLHAMPITPDRMDLVSAESDRHWDMGMTHTQSMSKNQFGEQPRTTSQVKKSLRMDKNQWGNRGLESRGIVPS